MSDNFARIATGIDPAPLLRELAMQPELWDQRPERRLAAGSPHGEMQDIWVRYRDQAEIDDPQRYAEPHWGVFYPAWQALPSLRPIVFGLMALTQSVHLGGVLITRLPPGARVHGHVDRSWHATFHNCKVYVALKTNPACINWFEDAQFVMQPGEGWWFNNQVTHGVDNHGDDERIALVVSMRREP